MRVIGLISGTSVDGIDAALVNLSGSTFDLSVDVLGSATYPYPAALRSQILEVCHGAPIALPDLAALDDAIAQQFARAALALQTAHGPADLIGSHGQTVFHRPPTETALGYTVQLGRGEAIAIATRCTTISNFRAADMAVGGQGAPLVPPIDACLLSHPKYHRCVQNLGGIGNVAYLPPRPVRALEHPETRTAYQAQVRGWDTGPGNVLLDLAVSQLSGGERTYDADGAWAAQGTIQPDLVQRWLQQDFFQEPPPKSTGRELFGQAYLEQCLTEATAYDLSPADLLATLTELTAVSVAHSYQTFLPRLPDQVLLCGGGSRNRYLHQRIQAHLPTCEVMATDAVGMPAEFKEAIAFAVLAYWRTQGIPGNLPDATGARRAVLLGDLHHGH
jgi:anhydro-N-acetylmuramic acid kinase